MELMVNRSPWPHIVLTHPVDLFETLSDAIGPRCERTLTPRAKLDTVRFCYLLATLASAPSEGRKGINCFLSLAELCSSSSSPSFQPIRSQIPIPTAHVMPSTAHSPSQRPLDSRSKSSLCKSASSPNLEVENGGGVKQDCLSRYRSLVNGLDHSLFPGADHNHTRLDEGQGFETPPVEPTLNQSGLLGGLGPNVRMKLHMTGLGDGAEHRADALRNALDQTYKVLPEARAVIPSSLESYGKTKSRPGENMADWQQKFESLRMQVEHMQVRERHTHTCLLLTLRSSRHRFPNKNNTDHVSG